MVGRSSNSYSSGKVARRIVGLGYWVQGLRCLPWMGVIFFLKDTLGVHPSTLQLLQNWANLPMIGKPIYGLVSDSVYILGHHRIPYILIGVFLQSISWLAVALVPPSGISVTSVTVFLLLSNLGASVVEVANDALVAETDKRPKSSGKSQETESSGELQSFVWMCSSIGGVMGNFIGGILIDKFSSQAMFLIFGLLLLVQLLATMAVNETSLDLPRNSSPGIRKQLSELVLVLRKPEIAYSIAWLTASYAMIPMLSGTMFFYQTEYLKVDSSLLGISKVFGQAILLLWSFTYNKHLKSISPRKLVCTIQVAVAVLMLGDALFVKRIFLMIGIPDAVYLVTFSGMLEVVFVFKVLPYSVFLAQLCPQGCEGSLMAVLMSVIALACIVSGCLGVVLTSLVGISANDFSGLSHGIIIQAVCTLLPLFWSSWIPNEIKPQKKD